MLDRKNLQQELLRFESSVIGMISNGIVHHTPKRIVLKQIKQKLLETVQGLGLSRDEVNRLWWNSVQKYNVISKKSFSTLRKQTKTENLEEEEQKRTDAVYDAVRKYAIRNDSAQKIAYELAVSAVGRQKHDEIFGYDGFIKKNQEKTVGYSPFFLCSVHNNCAKDHEAAQGKMYFDEEWKNFVKNSDVRKKISAYIRNRKLVSVQKICTAPVYLLTRPNCRHYLKNLPIDEVLGSSAKALVKRHKLYFSRENTVSPAKSVLNRYMKRLSLENELHKVLKSKKLLEDIKNDRQLVRKWKILSVAEQKKIENITRQA